jgi:hypothetical protein
MRFYIAIFSVIFSLWATFMVGCIDDEFIEVKETTLPAELFIASQSAIFSTIDGFCDIFNFNLENEIKTITFFQVIGSVKNTSIEIDEEQNLHTIILDFDINQNQKPAGRLGVDGLYRSGILKMVVITDEANLFQKGYIEFDSLNQFYIGDGNNQLQFIDGRIEINKTANSNLAIGYNNLLLQYQDEILSNDGDLVLSIPENCKFDGTEYLEINGNFSFQVGEGIIASVSILKPLKKRLVSDCIRPFYSGTLNFVSDVFINPIEIIFNPEKKQCEPLAELSLSGKKINFKY